VVAPPSVPMYTCFSATIAPVAPRARDGPGASRNHTRTARRRRAIPCPHAVLCMEPGGYIKHRHSRPPRLPDDGIFPRGSHVRTSRLLSVAALLLGSTVFMGAQQRPLPPSWPYGLPPMPAGEYPEQAPPVLPP